FADVHEQLARDAGALVAEVVAGRPPRVGRAPVETAFATLASPWIPIDTLDLVDGEGEERPAIRAKYPNPRFSLATGHDTAPGEVVGRVSLPLDTFGYEIGVAPGLQVQVNLTVLGLYNA